MAYLCQRVPFQVARRFPIQICCGPFLFRHCHRAQHRSLSSAEPSNRLSSSPFKRSGSLFSAWLLLKGTAMLPFSSRLPMTFPWRIWILQECKGLWLLVFWLSLWPGYPRKEITRAWLPAWNTRKVPTYSAAHTTSLNAPAPTC